MGELQLEFIESDYEHVSEAAAKKFAAKKKASMEIHRGLFGRCCI